ncbi:MAG: hypothetical protein JWS10_870 [Cypionkella sp.]|uniref:hypothetical protein n=1 Tax=Cypionkella sp. TaxID=2811411 RepID=UPI002611EEBD|nr:hypothetical protein [Cypionkella sp.]MDB5658255.1 hypothetical protein [Cypionkella sp.]
MTFKEFMATCVARHDARGHFIRLALADVRFSVGASFEELRQYMLKRHGSKIIADAGEIVWKDYQASERKARKIVGFNS